VTEFTSREVNLALLASAFALVANRPVNRAADGFFRPRIQKHIFDFAIAGRGYYELDKKLAVLEAGSELILIRGPQKSP
jgi:hypothetical protein